MIYECLFLSTGEHMKTLTNFLIDEDTRRDFQIWCIRNGTTVSDNLRSHIIDTLEDVERTQMPESAVMKNAGNNWSNVKVEPVEMNWEDTY
jgi:hypothetical protein